MLEWIAKYWLEVLFGLVTAGFGVVSRRLNKRLNKRHNLPNKRHNNEIHSDYGRCGLYWLGTRPFFIA